MKSGSLIFIFSIFFCNGLMADGYDLYAEQILKIGSQGHMNKGDAERKILDLKLREAGEADRLSQQARGVASAISKKKIIKIHNTPIEVSLSKK